MRPSFLSLLLGGSASDTPSGEGVARVCMAAGMSEKYDICDAVVPGVIPLLTREKAKELLADGIREIFRTHPDGTPRATIQGVRLKAGISRDETLSNAKEGRSLLDLDNAFNLLAVDPHVLDPLAAHFGKALVDKNPNPVDWNEVTIAAADLLAEVGRARAKGHVSHLDLPKLRTLVRRAMAAMQGAA